MAKKKNTQTIRIRLKTFDHKLIDISAKEIVETAKKIFTKNNWPIIDITRKAVEETAASVIKIYDIIHSQ